MGSPRDPSRRATAILVILLVVGPVLFNAVRLWSEVATPAISLNDDAFHYSLVERANSALTSKESVVDHWHPELELGFPQFFYYQHLPHVFVVFLNRILFNQASLFTLFNLVRWLLLVGFPLTVYWSMRRMRFSVAASAVAAAASSLISGNFRYGFEYDSYLWRGWGMYTQLWAMHLSFVCLALFSRVRDTGRGRVVAAIAFAALILSHLLYAFMIALAAVVVFLVGLRRRNLKERTYALASVAGLAAVISSYMWLPFFREPQYLQASPYLEPYKYDSFGAKKILGWLVRGELLDHGRLPVLTVLLGIGILAVLVRRSRQAWTALAIFVVLMVMYFGRPTLGPLADLVPFKHGMLFHRFIGGAEIAVIMLVGLAGGLIWEVLQKVRARPQLAIAAVLILVCVVPVVRERSRFYGQNATWMGETNDAFSNDAAAETIHAALANRPDRAYAGLRANFGRKMTFVYPKFTDALTYWGIPALSPPYQSLSLNSSVMWNFNDADPTQYELFDVGSVVAPANTAMPAFLKPILRAGPYVLYDAPGKSYAEFASVTARDSARNEKDLLNKNLAWLASGAPGRHEFIRWDYPADAPDGFGPLTSGCRSGEAFPFQRMLPGRLELVASCDQAATVVLKMTYHPNWRVDVDERPVPTYMVSPSYIAFDMPAGSHVVTAEYRSPKLKSSLLGLGLLALVFSVWSARRKRRLLLAETGDELTGSPVVPWSGDGPRDPVETGLPKEATPPDEAVPHQGPDRD